MTDREELELAAKEAGFVSYDHENSLATDMWSKGYRWNPLTDDGDALRLAVKLNIDHGNPGMRLSIDWQPNADPYTVTRRAIVRAAAEIGRSRT
jgi:hypothetical protein